jgi:hypothetical protein
MTNEVNMEGGGATFIDGDRRMYLCFRLVGGVSGIISDSNSEVQLCSNEIRWRAIHRVNVFRRVSSDLMRIHLSLSYRPSETSHDLLSPETIWETTSPNMCSLKAQKLNPNQQTQLKTQQTIISYAKQKGQTAGTTGKSCLLQADPTKKALSNAHETLVHKLRPFLSSKLIDNENKSLDTFSRRVRIYGTSKQTSVSLGHHVRSTCGRLKRALAKNSPHVVVGTLLLVSLGVLLGLLSSGGVSGSGGSGGSSGKGLGVGEVLLDLSGSLKLVVGSQRDVQQVLVRVDQRVTDRGDGRETGGQGDGSDLLDSGQESVEEDRLLNVEDLGGEDVSLGEDLLDNHSVGERRDVEHVQQGSLGGSDLDTSLEDLDVVDDFNGTTGNLGRDLQGLEERGLTGLHTSVTGGDVDVVGSNGTGSGRGSDLVGDNDLSDLLQVTRGEDETDVSLDGGQELLELRVLGDNSSESSSDHGVLSHQDHSLATESDTDLVQLVGTDIVDLDNEDGG